MATQPKDWQSVNGQWAHKATNKMANYCPPPPKKTQITKQVTKRLARDYGASKLTNYSQTTNLTVKIANHGIVIHATNKVPS